MCMLYWLLTFSIVIIGDVNTVLLNRANTD